MERLVPSSVESGIEARLLSRNVSVKRVYCEAAIQTRIYSLTFAGI